MCALLRTSLYLALGILLWSDSLPAETARPREIIFAVRQPGRGGHWYENFGYSAFDPQEKLYGAEGRLCRLDLASGELALLLEDPAGGVRDPQVHYDGEKILFSYRPGGTDFYHLYEIDIDGQNLRQLTDGPYDDIEPTYLPDGRILFCSSRCRRWVNCWYSPVAVLYGCDGDGTNIHPISGNIEHDNSPWPMFDGRVIYQRWEYVDRSRVAFHHLWTANPDGTGQMVYYGNLHPGTVMIDAKPIPGTPEKIVAVFSPNHGQQEHAGPHHDRDSQDRSRRSRVRSARQRSDRPARSVSAFRRLLPGGSRSIAAVVERSGRNRRDLSSAGGVGAGSSGVPRATPAAITAAGSGHPAAGLVVPADRAAGSAECLCGAPDGRASRPASYGDCWCWRRCPSRSTTAARCPP